MLSLSGWQTYETESGARFPKTCGRRRLLPSLARLDPLAFHEQV